MKESESEVSWSSQKSKRKHYFTRYSAATMAGKDAWQALFLAICRCQKWGVPLLSCQACYDACGV
ncbi:hypothetical protein C9146_22850 [Escherichia coli]|nr:hypothetical protein C9146_22850 [Escherichia coli]TJH99002.1 hypothetical protein C9145_23040 [Escherichia coli]